MTWNAPLQARAHGRAAAWATVALVIVLGSTRAAALGTLAVPTTQQQADKAKLVKELFKVDSSGKSSPARKALVQNLMKSADESASDPVAYYVLLHTALESAGDEGDVEAGLNCIARLGNAFALDSSVLEADLVKRAAPQLPAASLGDFATLCLTLGEVCCESGSWESARQVGSVAHQAAVAAKNPLLLEASKKQLSIILARQRLAQLAADALKRLHDDPEDKQNLTTAGEGICFLEHDWSRGLPMLARGSDAALASLAALELRGGNDVASCVAIAGRCFDVAAKSAEPTRSALQRRGARWYARALPQLQGLQKVVAQKRIDEAAGGPAGPVQLLIRGDVVHTFQRLDGSVSWMVARFLCEQAHGHLIIIPSDEVQVLATRLANDRNVWIGATEEGHLGDWRWIDGTPLSYTHWASGQPDNHNGVQHWGYIWRGDSTGGWDDIGAEQRYDFLCEWDDGR